MANKQKYEAYKTPSYPVIEAATKGDIDAINAVVKHYERYIAALSMRTLFDGAGIPHLCVDEEMQRRLRTRLITKILQFDASKIA